MSSAPTRSRATNRLALILASLAAAGFYAAAYLHHPHRPGGGGAASNQDWWAIGWDQPRYLRAALAWAAGNLDPVACGQQDPFDPLETQARQHVARALPQRV